MLVRERRLKLHHGQCRVFNNPSRFKVVVAGRRWGKTALAKTSIIENAAANYRGVVWYVAPTYNMAKDVMWPDLLDSIPRSWIRKTNETKMQVLLRNKCRIQLKGADNPDTLRGIGLNFVVLDEFQDIQPDAWKKVLRPTLATTGGGAMFIGTPKAFNYLYELYMLGQQSNYRRAARWFSWQFKSVESPFVPDSEVELARQDMDEKSFRQEFEASFESMGGRVYWPFDRQTHCDSSVQFNEKLPIWVGQDFNRDPMSATILQPQPNGELWAVDEIVLFNSNTQEAVDELERRYWRYQGQTSIFPDPAGSYQQHARGETDLDIFRERGYKKIYHRKKHPKVGDRVNCVNKLLKSAAGEIKLRVNPKCTFLIESMEQTIYKEGSRDVDKTLSVEHSADSIGYPVEYKFPMRKIIIAGTSL